MELCVLLIYCELIYITIVFYLSVSSSLILDQCCSVFCIVCNVKKNLHVL